MHLRDSIRNTEHHNTIYSFDKKYLDHCVRDTAKFSYSYKLQDLLKQKDYFMTEGEILDLKENANDFTITISNPQLLHTVCCILKTSTEMAVSIKSRLENTSSENIACVVKVNSVKKSLLSIISDSDSYLATSFYNSDNIFIIEGELLDFRMLK